MGKQCVADLGKTHLVVVAEFAAQRVDRNLGAPSRASLVKQEDSKFFTGFLSALVNEKGQSCVERCMGYSVGALCIATCWTMAWSTGRVIGLNSHRRVGGKTARLCRT